MFETGESQPESDEKSKLLTGALPAVTLPMPPRQIERAKSWPAVRLAPAAPPVTIACAPQAPIQRKVEFCAPGGGHQDRGQLALADSAGMPRFRLALLEPMWLGHFA
jgi:hypothetical protein